jgi:hypothetical protein
MIRVLNFLEQWSMLAGLFNMFVFIFVIEAVIKMLGV